MSEKKQVRDKGVPLSYHHGKAVSSLVDDCQTMHPPPADVRRLEQKKFYICSDVTHTHIYIYMHIYIYIYLYIYIHIIESH